MIFIKPNQTNLSDELRKDLIERLEQLSCEEYISYIDHPNGIYQLAIEEADKYGCELPAQFEIPVDIEIVERYWASDDITTIWYIKSYHDGGLFYEEIVGWYYGEPSPEATKHFIGKTWAQY
jgi:hypothetical protein